jgi:hypothetical protein
MTAVHSLPVSTQHFAPQEDNIANNFPSASPFTMLISSPATESKSITEPNASKSSAPTEKFDPMRHLAFTPPDNVLSMKDLGYPEDTGISPIAVSDPFQLFSKEAIEQMRSEILRPEAMKECGFQSNIAACQMRGYCPK